MKKLIFTLITLTILSSCQKEEFNKPVEHTHQIDLISFEDVTPENAEQYISQSGCVLMPDVIGQWRWLSVHHSNQPISDLTNIISVFNTITISYNTTYYPDENGVPYPLFGEEEWSKKRCNIVTGWLPNDDVFVQVQGDVMMMIRIGTTSDVWRLQKQ